MCGNEATTSINSPLTFVFILSVFIDDNFIRIHELYPHCENNMEWTLDALLADHLETEKQEKERKERLALKRERMKAKFAEEDTKLDEANAEAETNLNELSHVFELVESNAVRRLVERICQDKEDERDSDKTDNDME
ncbi:hypothetical protein Ae201684P_008861 [Aphanomyces euteiches]|uniref:Uncharacterized protein n=1 Tax=Aphanomyces euteiches TaxID=100861 RepID=A0A6G0WBU2_9STRA|nr:hypothetical protein Ae201684_016534 [Aphanomyces euteiches]KAH9093202.1 hypothetical protein Ae201684P_008861 [Aphanomyces euteiches]KAH9134402.1 hypothetical protein AeRB84_019855 [Aphanomyces euteiches]KAH9140620.1 hypothetical protein AeRB84_015161 [Aphanomyces euteiches]KAH9144842.1 hypothetical protein AeRB84_011215 [Aphanomyces euteiches]